MRAPAFWEGSPDRPAARLLAPLGHLYGRHTAARMDRPGVAAPCPVLCVGNFTLGGAGKTPTALALAALLRRLGAAPAFLTRGYGGRLAGPVAVDPTRHEAAETGDEPLLLARAGPTIVARDRPAGARLCAVLGADVIVMDDGLQNPSLAKDLSLAVVDAAAGAGNGLPFPAGPLRAPLPRQWRHVHGLVLIGEGEPGERLAREAAERGLAVHRAQLAPVGAAFQDRAVLAFAGIGRPEKFFASLREAGARIAGTRAFPDHHPYRPRDLDALAEAARRAGAVLVTTEKDHVRLPPGFPAETFSVTLRFEDEAALLAPLQAMMTSR
jgi:tetraacyldisaccharide 4'-kinase